MDSADITCNTWACMSSSARGGGLIAVIVIFGVAILGVGWWSIWRDIIFNPTPGPRHRVIESGQINRRGQIAAFFLGEDRAAKASQRRLKTSNNPIAAAPQKSSLQGNPAWEILGHLGAWLHGLELPQYGRGGESSCRQHRRQLSVLPPTRLASCGQLPNNPTASVSPFNSKTASNLVQPSIFVPSDSTSETPSTPRSPLPPPVTHYLTPPPDVIARDFAVPKVPRAYHPTRGYASSRYQVSRTYTPTGPTSAMPQGATIRNYDSQGSYEEVVREPERSYYPRRFSYRGSIRLGALLTFGVSFTWISVNTGQQLVQ